MGWTIPTTRATGYLVTAANWNTDIVDNLKYLKGSAGAIAIEDDIVLAAGKELVADKIFAGPYRALHLGTVREITIDWERGALAGHSFPEGYQIQSADGNGGDIDEGGTGQIVLKVDLDSGAGSYAWFALEAAQNNAFATVFNVSRNPYIRIEFANQENSTYSQTFLGFRQTPGNVLPDASAENFAGLAWFGTVAGGSWVGYNCDAGGVQEQTILSPDITASQRHVIEVIIVSGVEVEIWVDGTLEHTGTVKLPTGDLYFCVNFVGTGDPSANNGLLTVGKLLAQENLT